MKIKEFIRFRAGFVAHEATANHNAIEAFYYDASDY
jgi:hypothetical protein